MDSITRIAFVFEVETAYSRRLAAGISRIATPQRGFITRDFAIGDKPTALPASFEAWAPDAVTAIVSAEHEIIFEAMGEGKRPIVNMSRGIPRPTCGVVLAEAKTIYDAVHRHFEETGRSPVAQFVLGETPGGTVSRKQYQEYAESRGLECHCFTLAKEPDNIEQLNLHGTMEPDLAEWLVNLPAGAGIFTQQHFAGPHLCQACHLLKIPVPDRLAIIGTDGFDVALRSDPPLTTIRVPAEKIGFRAAELVIEMLSGKCPPKEIVCVPGSETIVCGSTVQEPQTGCDIGAALAFIEQHACEGITVGNVVTHTQGVSRVTFYKRFIQATGVKPAVAIAQRKLIEARRLLAETRLSIGTISGMCGFNNDLYFSQVFRKAEGVPPRDYRKMHLQR